jgi:hypothetical protein
METWFALAIIAAYAVGLGAWYRLSRVKKLKAAWRWPSLQWLDWESLGMPLLRGLELSNGPSAFALLPDGTSAPRWMTSEVPTDFRQRATLLVDIVTGALPAFAKEQIAAASWLSEEEKEWALVLAHLRSEPLTALKLLRKAHLDWPEAIALKHQLSLLYQLNAFNRELICFIALRGLGRAKKRFEQSSILFFVEALALAQLGMNESATNSLARAVYFSREVPFYTRAVLALPHLRETRPELVRQCQVAVMSPTSTWERNKRASDD